MGKILFISGPARNGNHLLMSMLDGHPQIQQLPGEDFLLREFFSRAKENEKKLVQKIKCLKNINYIINMSGAYKNKWKELYLNWKNNSKPKIWSGHNKINESHVFDYQSIVPKINYKNYEKYLIQNLQKIKNTKNFLDFFKIYLEALSKLSPKKNNCIYKHVYNYSGLRRELFYLLEKCENIIFLCPIRRFETFYFSYAKLRFKTTNIVQRVLDELWEHWRHKTIDYLLLKKKYPQKIIFIKFGDLINNNYYIAKKISKKLKVKFYKNLTYPTIMDKSVKGNSSFSKSDKFLGKIYKEPLKNELPKKILPKEYFEILKSVHKQCL